MRIGSTQAQIGASWKSSKLVPNGYRLKPANSKLLIGKVIDLHSKYHDAVLIGCLRVVRGSETGVFSLGSTQRNTIIGIRIGINSTLPARNLPQLIQPGRVAWFIIPRSIPNTLGGYRPP